MTDSRAARLGSWSKPLNFDLHVNWRGEPRVPFALHVQPKPGPRPYLACTAFNRFSCLPAELQQHVFYFCDNATLFQLTQVSLTRHEAMKLFWSDPDTWYSLDMDWLRQGGYAGETHCNLDLLAYVKHVEVNLFDMDPKEWTNVPYQKRLETDKARFDYSESIEETTDRAPPCTEEPILQFWRLLQELCPRITCVLISTSSKEQDPWDSPTAFLADFLWMCPANILVSVSLLQGHGGPGDPNYKSHMERSLWQLGDCRTGVVGAEHEWEKVLTDWEPRIVLLPPKMFRGPVGTFQQCLHKFERFCMQERAAQILLMECVEQDHFQNTYNPFVCFTPDCGARFEKPGEYSLHATKTRHYEDATPPENVRVLFDEYRRKLDHVHREANYKPFNLVIMNDDRTNKRSSQVLNEDQNMGFVMEEEVLDCAECHKRQLLLKQQEDDANCAFLHQLEHDPLYVVSQPANKSKLYNEYLNYVEEFKQEHWELYRS